MSVIAYIRKSTDKQSFEHQEYEIEQYAQKHNLKINRWVEESISSRKELKKRQLGALLEELKEGDVLIATEISRLGRSLLEVMGILQTCLEKNCQVITIKENYHLGNAIQSQVLGLGISLNCDINIGESSYLTFFPMFNARLMLFYCLSISAKTGEFHTCSNFNSDDEV